jgi:hypothetical protein
MSQSSGTKMGRKKESAIAALLGATSIAQAADICGVSAATLKRWMRDADFRAAFDTESRRLVEYSVGRARAGTELALETLQRNMASGVAPTVQVTAARVWLDHQRHCDQFELEARVRALEERAKLGAS